MDIFDASQVRLSELAVSYDVAVRTGDPIRARSLLLSALDLLLGNEQADSSANDLLGVDAAIICAYLEETYGLLAVGQDPFLRPLLPPVPTTGALVRRLVLGIGGSALRVNTSLIALGGELIATPVGDTPPPAPTAPVITNATFSAGGPTITSVTFTAV